MSASWGFPADGSYAPGTAYPLTVFVDGAGVPPEGILTGGSVAGFDLIASAGSISTFPNDDSVQRLENDLTHTFAGTRQNHWTFRWTAPASGEVTIYVAGNAVSGDGSNQGDLWNGFDITIEAGAGSGGQGLACDPPLPLPQLIPLPVEAAPLPAH